MDWIWYVIIGIILLPAILWLIRVFAGLVALILIIVGIILILSGTVGGGIAMIVVGLILGAIAPAVDPWDFW